MEIIPEGKHFRLVQDNELPEILKYLERYLPEALKVCILYTLWINIKIAGNAPHKKWGFQRSSQHSV